MTEARHKVFISYHRGGDQDYKDALLRINDEHNLFIDASVDTGDIDDNLSDETIRQKIRDEYLSDSTVTIVLVGLETRKRKHVDWEIYSSMFDGKVNKKSGVLVVNLPATGSTRCKVGHGKSEKKAVYPNSRSWTNITDRSKYEERYPYMPARIIDNLLKSGAKVSVTSWDLVTADVEKLRFLINAAHEDKASCDYDLRRRMRRANS
ncbi:MAG: TIR domain-containing protein [Woeseiaceae bacterium]|nr:TIR domain-containing protein [Woeseiaceae bacterium]